MSRADAPRGYPVDEHNRAWLASARQLAALSTDSVLTLVEDTDHNLPLRQPGIVADAIAGLVLELRSRVPGAS